MSEGVSGGVGETEERALFCGLLLRDGFLWNILLVGLYRHQRRDEVVNTGVCVVELIDSFIDDFRFVSLGKLISFEEEVLDFLLFLFALAQYVFLFAVVVWVLQLVAAQLLRIVVVRNRQTSSTTTRLSFLIVFVVHILICSLER